MPGDRATVQHVPDASSAVKGAVRCRHCGAQLSDIVVDLGVQPLCESYLTAEDLDDEEPRYPLQVYVCRVCWLVQLEEFVAPREIFSEYAYFSSYSASWVEHARRYVHAISARLGLDVRSRVVEVGSNDGYLLQHFLPLGIPVLGVEPAANIATAAIGRGVPTRVEFFGAASASALLQEGVDADLIVGNNVLAQVPDLNDFVTGLARLLKPGGTITLEVPHLVHLVEQNQFDTIYHEHFSYFSLLSLRHIVSARGLEIYDVEEIPTHGGSLRAYVRHARLEAPAVSARVIGLLEREERAGYASLAPYRSFGGRVEETRRALTDFLIDVKRQGKRIVGYGAPGKGNTLLNYCGIGTDVLDFTVDRNPYKHGKFLPGSHVPVFPPERLVEARPDYVLILPWNLKDEIKAQMAVVRSWGGRFIVPIPEVRVEA
jgi:SAM-dependent methyltransferase